jgi:hypothetical protein
LPAGTWWIKADYENYQPDSFLATIDSEGAVSGLRDLVLHPDPSMDGQIYLDMNNDGSYETSFTIEIPVIGLDVPGLASCPVGGGNVQTLEVSGVRGNSNSDFDYLYFGFDVAQITGSGIYPTGGLMHLGCSANGSPALVWYITSRRNCSGDLGYGPMSFGLLGDPEVPGCDCGITNPGNLYLTDWGTELTDLVAGGVTIDLPGWANCYCSSGDEDGDGIDDDITVECAKARLNIDFKLLVGTKYLVTWTPLGSATRPGP